MLDLIGLAETRLIQREAEEAARLGHGAVDAAGRTRSDRVRVKLAAFHKQAGRYPGVPAVAELRDRMAGMLAIELA